MTANLSKEELELRCKQFDENYKYALSRIEAAAQKAGKSASDIQLLAATKTVPVEVINHAIGRGITLIGENRVQELCQKYDDLDKSATRHHIGRLQTNKVKQVVGKVQMVQSVDSLKLASELSKRSLDMNLTTDILVEINIGNEVSKSGIPADKTEEFLHQIATFEGIKVKGLMCIPPICENDKEIRVFFDKMYQKFIDISAKKIDNISMDFLSMGMSGDFEQAIESGANIIRLGSVLFGAREYK